MQEQVKLPDLGEGVESATVVGILIEEGDDIEEGQDVFELETDKAVAQLPSPKTGTVEEIHVEKNQEVSVGDLLITLDVDDGNGKKSEEEDKQETEEQAEDTEPDEEEDTEEDDEPAKTSGRKKDEAEADTAEEEEEDTSREQAEEPEEDSEDEEEEAKEESAAEREEPDEEAEPEDKEAREEKRRRGKAPGDAAAAPSTRRLARELGVDLDRIDGSGKSGAVTSDDVKRAARALTEMATPDDGGELDEWGEIRREAMPAIRKTIARRMRESKDTAAHVTHFDDADVTELEAFRKKHRNEFEDIEFTPLPFVVRASLGALKDHPMVNASLDLENGEIIYKKYYSIGIAVATDRGLIVPVLRNADKLSIFETAKAIERLSERVRSGDFDSGSLKGGTFTVSNLGAIGGRYATPIINAPEAAVLLPGRARRMPVVRDNGVEIRLMLPLSLTYDHRLIDGAEAQRFLNDVKSYLEDPGRLLTR